MHTYTHTHTHTHIHTHIRNHIDTRTHTHTHTHTHTYTHTHPSTHTHKHAHTHTRTHAHTHTRTNTHVFLSVLGAKYSDKSSVCLCSIDPRVRRIRNEAPNCPGVFSGTLRFGRAAARGFSPASTARHPKFGTSGTFSPSCFSARLKQNDSLPCVEHVLIKL